MKYERNVSIYYSYSIFAELLILGPIIVLFLLSKGLSFTEIMVLQSISAISVIVFEVPTGALADRIGRKYSLILGSIFWSISLIVYILGDSFLIFAIAEIVFSLGATFKSGADTALIYDTLALVKRENEFQKIEGHARSLALYAQAFGSIIAGFVYEVNGNLPLIISIGFMIITIIIAFNFKEPPKEHEKEEFIIKYVAQIKDSGTYILKHEKLKALILYSMVFFIFYRAGFWYFQPYMEGVNIPVKYFGIIFFIFNIVAAITSKYSYKIMELTKPKTLTFMSILLIVSFIILGTVKVSYGVLAILLQQIARGLYRPVMYKYLNKHIPSEKRATVLSFQSLSNNLASAITLPLVGLLLDSTDIFTTHLVMAIAMILLTYISLKYINKRLGKRKETTIVIWM